MEPGSLGQRLLPAPGKALWEMRLQEVASPRLCAWERSAESSALARERVSRQLLRGGHPAGPTLAKENEPRQEGHPEQKLGRQKTPCTFYFTPNRILAGNKVLSQAEAYCSLSRSTTIAGLWQIADSSGSLGDAKENKHSRQGRHPSIANAKPALHIYFCGLLKGEPRVAAFRLRALPRRTAATRRLIRVQR